MGILGGLSIRHKLALLSILPSGVALILAFAAFAYFEVRQQRQTLIEEITAISEIIGHNSTAAMVFHDQDDAKSTLLALRSTSFVRAAYLLTPDKKVFASQIFDDGGAFNSLHECSPSDGLKQVNGTQVTFRGPLLDILDLCRPLIVDGSVVGTLQIIADFRPLADRIHDYVTVGAAATLLLLILATLLSWWLQGMISRPISELARVMTRVARDKDYTLRTEKRSNDEVGTLIEHFNDMMSQLLIHEASLTAARLEAEAANRAISSFLANTSHELRTPLNAIIGFSEMIKRQVMGPVSPTYISYANDIWESGGLLLEIINSLLDLSKIEAGKFEIAESQFEIEEIVQRTIKLVADRANSSNLALDVELQPDLPMLYADNRLIRQCLLNLLSNAIKFTPAGGRIAVRAALDTDGGLFFSVSDTGIGMKAKDIEIALTPFGQVDSKYTRKHEGTGLGLPLVKKFAELHGGRIEIDSEPKVGTTVRLHLPGNRLRR